MKSSRIFAAIVCIVLCGQIARAQDMDAAITKLTEDVAAKIKENGNKKVTVLDFTDLDGNSSELGKYVAEQLTVDFVMTKRDFSVLDRANLKKILDEQKLSASGLVNPENAKKLGMVSGVDAMIFGTIVPVGQNINVTVKVITTETAEVAGGAKTKFVADDSVQQMLSKSSKTEKAANTGHAASTPSDKPFGDLQAKIESITSLPNNIYTGYIRMTLIISNASETTTYGVAIKSDFYRTYNVSNDRGDEFHATEVSGIQKVSKGYDARYQGELTDIPPKTAIKIVSKSQTTFTGKPGEYRPFHFQTEVVFGPELQGRYPGLKEYNLVLDVK